MLADTDRVGTSVGLRRRTATQPATPPTAPAAAQDAEDPAPQQLHRGITLLATISLFIGTRSAWTTAISSRPAVAAVISLCYASILICGALGLLIRTRRALTRIDAAVLITALALAACGYLLHHTGADEAALTAQAADQIRHGHPVYGQPWPWLFDLPHVGLTKTMSGGADYTYGYPPLTALLASPVHAVIPTTAAATLVTTGALFASTVLLWFLLPAPWRSAATAVCLGFGFLPHYAAYGYPAIIALALLIPVVVRWPQTGQGGRLGSRGTLRAISLGAACAAQQLAWFFTPFLLIGLYAVRRGELGPRRALALTARYTATAALTWSAVNAYFAAQDFSAWLDGIFLPLNQKAILHGQGAMGISYYFTAGSSHLDYYTYASQLLLLGLLAATLLFLRRLGPAITVLPWIAFYLAPRSQDGYFLLMTPLWLAAAATVPAAALATAWQPRLPRLTSRRAKAALAAGLLAPAFACVAIAASSRPPLQLTLTPRYATHGSQAGVTAITLRAVNTTGSPLTPHFASRQGHGASNWWTIQSGPATLAPHTTANYTIKPPGGFRPVPGGHSPTYLIAVTATPMTITTAPIAAPAAEAPASADGGD